MSFQINSDLHLEVGQQYSSFQIPASAPYLVLAGDIGRLVDYDSYLVFLKTQTEQFELISWVLGNHEFYTSTFTTGLERARRLEEESCLAPPNSIQLTKFTTCCSGLHPLVKRSRESKQDCEGKVQLFPKNRGLDSRSSQCGA